MIKFASPGFIPALPPPDSRVWVRLNHSELRVWTNQCNPRIPVPGSGVGGNPGLQQVEQGIPWPQRLFKLIQSAWCAGLLFTGGKVTLQPFMKDDAPAVPGPCLQICRKPEDKANTKLRTTAKLRSNLRATEGQPTFWTPLLHKLIHFLYCLNQFELDLLVF